MLQILLLGDALGVMRLVGLAVGWVFVFVCGRLGCCWCWIVVLCLVFGVGFGLTLRGGLWLNVWWRVCILLAGRWFVLDFAVPVL